MEEEAEGKHSPFRNNSSEVTGGNRERAKARTANANHWRFGGQCEGCYLVTILSSRMVLAN